MVFYKAQQSKPGSELFSKSVIVSLLSNQDSGFSNLGFKIHVSNTNRYFICQVNPVVKTLAISRFTLKSPVSRSNQSIDQINNKFHWLLPPGGFASLAFDQAVSQKLPAPSSQSKRHLHFASIRLCLALLFIISITAYWFEYTTWTLCLLG